MTVKFCTSDNPEKSAKTPFLISLVKSYLVNVYSTIIVIESLSDFDGNKILS